MSRAFQNQVTIRRTETETDVARTIWADIVALPIRIVRAHGVHRVRGRARPVPPNQLHGEELGASAVHVQQRDEEHERPAHLVAHEYECKRCRASETEFETAPPTGAQCTPRQPKMAKSEQKA